MIPKPGIYPAVPFEEYRAWEAVNWHTLWRLIEESPAHAKDEQEEGTEDTKALAFGALTDFVLLEPARFQEQAVIEPEIGEGKAPRRPTSRQINAKKPSPETVEAIRFWDEWDEANAGKIIVKAADYDTVLKISSQIHAAQCRELICGGNAQMSMVWIDPATGLLCKGRMDFERNDGGWTHFITDLKTSRSAKKWFWRWAINRYGYAGQMAFYHDGWAALHDGEESKCIWLVVEKHGKCRAKGWECKPGTIRAGRDIYRKALDTWAECVKKNEYPDYGGIELIGLDDYTLQVHGVDPRNPDDEE